MQKEINFQATIQIPIELRQALLCTNHKISKVRQQNKRWLVSIAIFFILNTLLFINSFRNQTQLAQQNCYPYFQNSSIYP